MSRIALSGNPSGSGTLTIASPNTNSDATFNLPTTGGDLLVNGASQAATFSALTVNGNNISATNSLGFRNRIINGDMRIDQRNNGASVTVPGNAAFFGVDRWRLFESSDGVITTQQSSVAPTGFNNSLLVTVTTQDTSIASDQFVLCEQRIEGFNVADLGWGTASAQSVTLSFWVRSSVTGTFGGAFANSAFNRSYPFTYTINSANTWEQKTLTIPGETSGTWLTTNGIGILMQFGLGVGSVYSGTAGAWATAGLISATGATNLMATLNATWQVTGVQLEAGSVATPFERRPYGTELALCQRYYWQGQYCGAGCFGGNGTVPISSTLWPVQMRATPTVSYISGGISSDGISDFAITGLNSVRALTNQGGRFLFTQTGVSAGGRGCDVFEVNMSFNSEL